MVASGTAGSFKSTAHTVYGAGCVRIEFLKYSSALSSSALFYSHCSDRVGVVGTLEPAVGSGKQSSTGVSIATYVTRATHMHTRTEACALSQPCREISCISVRIHTPTLSVPH